MSDKTEILFWKVFKNQYLFNKIFNQIHNNEWIEYDEPNKYNVYNRCKFGDTHSLVIMIKNDLLPLIKDKIKHGDHIEINTFSIKDLFSKLSTDPLIDNKNKNKNKYKDEDYLEIIELLMKNRRDDFEITDLICIAAATRSPDVIRLLVNEPYSVVIYPKIFEFAIMYSNLATIKELINLESINFKNYGIKLISEEFKRKSLSLAVHRTTLKTTITEYIFNNPSLYSIPPPLSLLNNQQKQEQQTQSTNKKLKTFETLHPNLKNNSNNNNNNDNEEIKYEYIKFKDFIKLKSSNLLKSFMKLDIVVLSETKTNFNSFLKMYHPYERLQVGIKIILKYDNTISDIKKREEILEEINKIDRSNETGFNKLKELRKLVAIEFPNQINFYFFYWKAYREKIKKLGKVPYKSGSHINTQTFGHLLLQDELTNYQTNTQKGDKNIEQVELLSYITYSDSESENEVEEDTIIEKELSNFSNRFRNATVFDISNRYSNLLNSYLKAIKECNIEKLERIDTNNPMFKLDVSKYHCFQLPNEKEDIMKIWEYFNKHSFKQMIPNYDILIEFLSSVTNIIPPFELKISNIKEPLSGKLGTILLWQLYKKNFNITELLLNSFDNFNFIYQPEQMSAMVDKERVLFLRNGELFQIDKKFSFQIIRIIKLVMDKFNKLTKDQINIENISTTTYRLILNNLYDQLLRVKGLTIDQLEYVRSIIPEQLFNNNSFETYRIFFYLNIRSSKLTNYITKRPGITSFIDNSIAFSNHFYNSTEPVTNEIIGFDLRKYLNFELFTYDYILGRESNRYSSGFSGGGSSSGYDDGSKNNNKKYITQVDTILKELIKQLSFNICTNVNNRDNIVKGDDFFKHSLNADLRFSLDIGRKDLFWELLDWIQQYMIKNENLMKLQVYQFNSPYESLLPTGTIFSNVKIIKKELPSPPKAATETITTIESTFLKIDNFEKPIPNESSVKIDWNSDKLIEAFKPVSKLINSFKYSDEVMGSVCKVMNVNEIQRFIQYNFFESFFQNAIYKYSVFFSRDDLMSFLLNNYNIDVDFPLSKPDRQYSQYLECKSIFENHFEKVKNISKLKQFNSPYLQFPFVFLDSFFKYICKENNITTYNQFVQNYNLQIRKQIIKETIEILIGRFLSDTNDDDDNDDYDDEDPNQNFAFILKNQKYKVLLIQLIIEQSDTQLYFKSALDQVLLKLKEDRKNYEINSPFIENLENPFLQAFINGDIKTCNIILKYYPNQFKITKDSITETLKMEKIHIIKYFYKVDNCKNLINNFENDNNLLKHLKNELSKHLVYKYHLTWL
ncbi:hypothetical protein DDB_G0277643 [Dictyostelium discoideum AX4]|uniref:Uncharacterized protein n=1 Tax=Dictyostelium discoideum TaxID=44689 RepID=Q54ZF7_DICDI|nr:hypothetical protein DDB_G0277643 [Dictyostelium discoideum AX4]EAL68639.1 hypothetical protein DDB_G0277643 [Dictyostelium discoideum AX4]|eukprot:XP_642540.1 hypothetical protein DDB_G0277643 [Dictyostelium discoideum AX4]